MAVGTIFDYLEWRGDLPISKVPLNVVDSLILTVISYVRFADACTDEPIRFSEAVRRLEELPVAERFRGLTFQRDTNLKFIRQAAASERFRNILITDCVDEYNEEDEKQFAAMTFLLPDGSMFIAYRGTDNTLIGWKEDINMSFTTAIPAQRAAAAYAQRMAEKHPQKPIRIGGHSKGGNLSIWAAAHLPEEARDRLVRVFNHDGPGFTEGFLHSEGYRSIADRVISVVPESSIVGVLMSHSDYLVIKSNNLSLMQHDPFSWQVIGRRFVYGLERTASAKKLENSVNGLVASMTPTELEVFVEKVYGVLQNGKVKTLDDLTGGRWMSLLLSLPQIIRESKSAATKKML